MATKLVSNNQGLEVARMAQDMELPRVAFQKALTDGTVKEFLRGLIPDSLEYPGWVREHLTPELEAKVVQDPGEVELWLDPRQESRPYPTGAEVYETLKNESLLERTLSYGELRFFEENLDRIPADWRRRGLWVYGWASVIRISGDYLRVPHLFCRADQSYVYWLWLDYRWHGFEYAGLRAA